MSKSKTNFDLIGRIPSDYKLERQIIQPFPEIRSDEAVIKSYSMTPISKTPFSQETMSLVEELIKCRLSVGAIKRRLGLGFLIVSEGIINVSIWGMKYPSLPDQTIYSFDKPENMAGTIKRLDKRTDGNYCAWEAEVFGHEARAWRKYMFGERKEANKLNYINDVFRGIVE